MWKKYGRIFLGALYAVIPIIGWIALYRSFKQVKSDQLAMIQNFSGQVELIEKGIHFRPFPGDRFSQSYSKTLDYIDFGAKKIVRIRPGTLGVKTNAMGEYVELAPGMHTIDAAEGETFHRDTGVQEIGQDDYCLGNYRYINIRNGELGESYLDGQFVLLEAGKHKLPANHRFVKKVAVDSDVIDLGAEKIVTVKEGQVAVVNTAKGVVVHPPGKHRIKQSEGNFFNALITTSPQGVKLPPLDVMCSDKIEMRAESMLTYKITDPLKTVGLGIERIIEFLVQIADGTLRTILSRFSSSDIAPSLHTDEEHHSSKRADKLKSLHDECVAELGAKAKDWGLEITDLQITQILPADEAYLATIRQQGAQQSAAATDRSIAENEAQIAQIRAKAEESKVTAAKMEQEAALVQAETGAQTLVIQAKAKANQLRIEAEGQAQATRLKARADAARIKKLNRATKETPAIMQEIMKIEAQGKIMQMVQNPVFVQPDLGHTSHVHRNAHGGLTLFSTDERRASLTDAAVVTSAAHILGAS